MVQTTDQAILVQFRLQNPDNSLGVFGLCNPNFYDIEAKLKDVAHLLWGEEHSRLCNPEHIFFM